ncbi:MAG: single-stranded DNA-binding protein [Acidobacteriota bacterium]|nr:single-stranded DNA-binding protein [Acidobacteriota bacterium]
MDHTAQAAQTIAKFLQTFTSTANLKLRFRVKLRTDKPPGTTGTADSEDSTEDPKDLLVEFTGPDTPLLVARNGEVLNALEHVASKILRLEPEEHHRVFFDADHFKANRERELHGLAQTAIERVQTSGHPYSFPPMSSRERRQLHLLLAEAGMPTASSGEGPARFVVLYPAGQQIREPEPARRSDPEQIRRAFRHR